MKRIVAGSRKNQLLATLDTILRHWGYRVLASTKAEQIRELAKEVRPDLLILDAEYLDAPETSMGGDVADRVRKRQLPLLVLCHEGEGLPCSELPHQCLSVPLDIFALFELTQQHLQPIPRKNLRLPMQLPGLIFSGGTSSISEVLSLSIHGMFVKTSARIPPNEPISILFPLTGMKTEVEIKGRILYLVEPRKENSYMQGAGIEFIDTDESTHAALEKFLERRLLGNISDGSKEHSELDPDQLKKRARETHPGEKH